MAKRPTNFSNTIRTPHAAVLIWNYANRLDANNISAADVNTVNQVIISTLSLINIQTSKSKGAAAGSFNLTLAPTKNWVEVLTPGSWMCIMMGTRRIVAKDFTHAAHDLVKMLCRIDSVRVNVGVDQGSAARMTTYTVSGQDWGQIFDANMYIDPIARDDNVSAISNAERFIYDGMLTDINSKSKIPTTSQNVSFLLRLVARPLKSLTEVQKRTGLLIKPENNFQFPPQLISYFNFKSIDGTKSTAVGNAVEFIPGKLYAYDSYTDTQEAVSIIDPASIFGQHTLWQLMQDNCNHILNELVTDLKWDSKGKPSLALYKRIRPFIIRNNTPDLNPVKDLVSLFENVKRVHIPLPNIVAINAGNNWRDKYNFIEVQIDKTWPDNDKNKSAQIKLDSQSFDAQAFNREGFRPMIAQTNALPTDNDGTINPFKVTKWKGLLRAWYFETHELLNGAITFMGIDEHIKVGDNIIVSALALGKTQNLNAAERTHPAGNAYLLAHVENISHTFNIDPNGTRSYSTTVQFVRGVITDLTGKQFHPNRGDGRLDSHSRGASQTRDNNTVNVFGTSTALDPDKDKVKGT